MLVIHQRTTAQANGDAELELSYEARSKSRLRCFSTTGEEVGLFLERGQPPLREGECLLAQDGRIVIVRARAEQLLHVTCANSFELTRARSEEHTSELQSRENIVCRLLLEKNKIK